VGTEEIQPGACWAAGDSNCAWAKKKQEHPKILENFGIVSTGISSHFKNSFGKTIGALKTASAGESLPSAVHRGRSVPKGSL
jgi:hypothetical protein